MGQYGPENGPLVFHLHRSEGCLAVLLLLQMALFLQPQRMSQEHGAISRTHGTIIARGYRIAPEALLSWLEDVFLEVLRDLGTADGTNIRWPAAED